MSEQRYGQAQYDAYGPRPSGSPPRTERPKDSILHPDNLAKLRTPNYDAYDDLSASLAQAGGALDRLEFYGHAPPHSIEVNEERAQFVWYKQHEYAIYARLYRSGHVEVDILDFTPYPAAGIDYPNAFEWNIFYGMK